MYSATIKILKLCVFWLGQDACDLRMIHSNKKENEGQKIYLVLTDFNN